MLLAGVQSRCRLFDAERMATLPEYYISADNLAFIQPQQLAESLRVCFAIVDVLEQNRRIKT